MGLQEESDCVVLAQGLGRLYLVCPPIEPWDRVVMGYVVFLWLGFVNVGAVTQEDKALQRWGGYSSWNLYKNISTGINNYGARSFILFICSPYQV